MQAEDNKTKDQLVDEIRHLQSQVKSLEFAMDKYIITDDNVQLSDLISVEELQKIQDAFSKATGVASIITHPDGRPITKPSNFCYLCQEIIRKTNKGLKNCYLSDAVIGRFNADGPIVQPCLSGGLYDAGASIRIGDRHIANWLIGQVRDEKLNDENFIEYARKIGADEENFRNALKDVTIMPLEQFENVANALFLIANQLSQVTYQNLLLKRASEAQKKSDERYRGLFDHMSSGVAILRPIEGEKDFLFIDFNPAAQKIEQVKKDEVVGYRLSEVFPGARDFGIIDIFCEVATTGKPQHYPTRFYIDENHSGWRENFVFRLSSGDVISVYDDVTERQQALENLHASEERFRRIAENAKDIIYRMSLPDGKYEYMSPAASDIFGYSPEELYEKPTLFHQLLHPDWHGYFKDQWNNLLRGIMPPTYEYQIIDRYGRERWLNQRNVLIKNDKGDPIAIEGIVTDVTERKAMIHQLQLSESRFRMLIEQSPLAIEVYNESGVLIQTNNAWRKFWNLQQDTGITGLYNIFEDTLIQMAPIVEMARNALEGKKLDIAEIAVSPARFGRSGERRYVHITVYPLVSALDQVNHIVLMYDDITAEVQYRKERETLIHELENKNAELERFTYTVSHDLKSPLITIRGFIGMIKKDFASGKTDTIEGDFDRISNAADRMYSLLEDVLHLSRIGRTVSISEKVSLESLAREVVSLFDTKIRDRNITVTIGDGLPTVNGDRVRLYEVMQNLFENAIKFLKHVESPKIDIGAENKDGRTICYIKDNGVGIDPRYHERIFGLFDQLDQSVDGTGVGLALVKRIVETHGGRIWVESEGLGKGSTFCFFIPENQVVDKP
ncbi:MAG: PocR ligand-binding domain-containing protein [Candidatus Zixiibacteriota bacterium]